MASMILHDIDDRLKARLLVRAAQHGHSMEEEARDILRAALSGTPARPAALVEAIRSRIEPLGGIDLNLQDADDAGSSPPL